MKLYPILFTEHSGEQLDLLSPEQLKAPESAFKHLPPKKGPDLYKAPDYALYKWKSGKEEALSLVHVQSFMNWLDIGGGSAPARQQTIQVEDWLCAYAGTHERHTDDCSNAIEINFMVASPKYPAAGAALYALMANHFGKPITSDRDSSTSNAAKKAWARIETDKANWSKVFLDNYDHNDDYFDIKGSWPDRTVTQLDEPQTPDRDDDCKLPPISINRGLGSANAWSYHGPLNAHSLLARGSELLDSIDHLFGFDQSQITRWMETFSEKLFTKFYHGISG